MFLAQFNCTAVTVLFAIVKTVEIGLLSPTIARNIPIAFTCQQMKRSDIIRCLKELNAYKGEVSGLTRKADLWQKLVEIAAE